jgi:twitching motility two-component system response regulator PilH
MYADSLKKYQHPAMPIRKILIVDDSATNRHVLFEMLARHGYRCSLAESGKEAIEKAKSEKPDMILMDVVMPDMDGYQATRVITRDEATKHIPVILCTSKDQETDRLWGLRQGAKNYVVKPVEEKDLLEKITALR